jgi:hypothetical protein
MVCWVMVCTPVIPALGRLRQEEREGSRPAWLHREIVLKKKNVFQG